MLGWKVVYAFNKETFGPDGTLGRADTKEAVLTRDLRAALGQLNPDLPASAIDDAVRELTIYDVSRSMVQHNRDFYRLLAMAFRSSTRTPGPSEVRPCPGDRLRQRAGIQSLPRRA